MTTTDNKTKAKRQMSEEQLEKLKYAREKALEKRRELAEILKMERDLQLKEKEAKVETIKAKHSKMNSKAVTNQNLNLNLNQLNLNLNRTVPKF